MGEVQNEIALFPCIQMISGRSLRIIFASEYQASGFNKFAEGTALAKEGLAIGKQTAGKICSMLGKLGEQAKQSEDVQQAVGQIKDSFKTVFGGLFGKK